MAHAFFEPGHALHSDVPLSCGEAWIEYSQSIHRSPRSGNVIEHMQEAFDAGWQAALAALRAQNL